MELYSIGTINNTNSSGPYGYFFEPNAGSSKDSIHTSLISKTESNVMVTRKKAEKYHTFVYKYDNLWQREYRQIKRFFDSKDGRVTSFYLVDTSEMQPCTLSTSTTNYVVTKGSDRTSLNTESFTATTGQGSYYCCVWKPKSEKFRIGKISAVASNTSLTFPDATDYGNLTVTSTNVALYPVYRVFFGQDQLSPKPGDFNPEEDDDGGLMHSLDVNFIQRDTR